ncbi:MAG: efflux RND transporter periplasmic adaptor subunit [Chlamydiota bacterium]|nr:efflux RND transporter periplasmic adaptor subunit [Chlamydiota bacterium]
MLNPKQWLIILAGSILLIGGGTYWRLQQYVYTNDAHIEAFRINIAPDLATMRVHALLVEEGDAVRKGSLVSILEQDIVLPKLAEGEAALGAAKEATAYAAAHLKKEEEDYQRAIQGADDAILSTQDFQHHRQRYLMARAQYEEALAHERASEERVKLMGVHVGHTELIAPCDGYIAKRWAYVGDVKHPGEAIFTMYDSERVWIEANVSEKKIRHVKVGSRADIFIDAYPGVTFQGHVFAIKGAAASQFSVIPQNNATGNYTKVAQRVPVKIAIDTPHRGKYALFPGMNAEAKIFIDPPS